MVTHDVPLEPLSSKVVVVTGAGQGIGFAIASGLELQGYTVVVVDRNEDRVLKAVDAIGGNSYGLTADVSTEDGASALAAAVQSDFGDWYGLINNAGSARFCGVVEGTVQDWDLVLDANLKSAWLCMRAAAPVMQRKALGRIVNISSIAAYGAPSENLVAYSAAKAGLSGLTKSGARELGPFGVTVNLIAPGAIVTEAWEKFGNIQAMKEQKSKDAVLGRVGDASEICEAVAYFLSDKAGFVTAQELFVDGGRTDKI